MDRVLQIGWLIVVAVGVETAILGCGKVSDAAMLQSESAADNADQKPVAEDTTAAAGPTAADYEEFGWKFVAAIWEDDARAANAQIDWRAIIDAATPPLGDSPFAQRWRRDFFAGFKATLNRPNGLAGRMSAYLQKGGDFAFLRTRNVDGRQRVILRQIQADGGVEYYDMIVEPGDDGVLRAVDIYVATQGEWLSDIFSRIVLPAVRNQLPQLLGRPSDEERDFIDSLPKLAKINTHLVKDEHAQALEVHRSLPKSVREHKFALIQRMQAASGGEDSDYLAALDDFRRLYPDDPCIDLLSIDWHILREEYDKALEGIRRFDRELGGDPFLKVSQGYIVVAQGKMDEAKVLGRQAIEEEPTLEDAYWLLVTISLEEEDFATTAELLTTLEQELEIEFEDLTTVDGYEGFVKSDAYRGWLKRRPADNERETKSSAVLE